MQYDSAMDGYEKGVLLLTTPSLIAAGLVWRPLQKLMLTVGGLSLLAIWLYHGLMAQRTWTAPKPCLA